MAEFNALVELASHWMAFYVEMKIKNRKTEDGFYHIATHIKRFRNITGDQHHRLNGMKVFTSKVTKML